MRTFLALILLGSAAQAQVNEAALAEAASICQRSYSRPHEVRPESNFRKGFEGCDELLKRCMSTEPNCIAKAAQEVFDKSQQKQVQDVLKGLSK